MDTAGKKRTQDQIAAIRKVIEKSQDVDKFLVEGMQLQDLTKPELIALCYGLQHDLRLVMHDFGIIAVAYQLFSETINKRMAVFNLDEFRSTEGVSLQ